MTALCNDFCVSQSKIDVVNILLKLKQNVLKNKCFLANSCVFKSHQLILYKADFSY